MQITKRSMLTGKVSTMELDVTEEQLKKWLGGELIQDAMPHLTPDEREFLISGVTPDEWTRYFGQPSRLG